MKIYCECGCTIVDSTDYIAKKAHFFADQDHEDMWDSVNRRIERLVAEVRKGVNDEQTAQLTSRATIEVMGIVGRKTRLIYQCHHCGRLYVDDVLYQSQIFVPKNDAVPRNLLRSIEGENWKRPLRGHWQDSRNSGNLSWGFGVEDEGFKEFDNWEELEKSYFEVFDRLVGNNTLRTAMLKRNGEIIHSHKSPENTA